jgi:hypothetical protein
VAACYADPTLAQRLLGWQARHDLDRMCADSWRWQSMNPKVSPHELKHHPRATRHHGRRVWHAAVAAVACWLSQAVSGAVGQYQPVPAGRGTLAWAWRMHRSPWLHPLVVGNEEHRFLVLDQLRELKVEPSAVMLEPMGRNTAPAVTWPHCRRWKAAATRCWW